MLESRKRSALGCAASANRMGRRVGAEVLAGETERVRLVGARAGADWGRPQLCSRP